MGNPRVDKYIQEHSYEDSERQVIMPSLFLGLILSAVGLMFTLTGLEQFDDWFYKNPFMGRTFLFLMSVIGCFAFLVWIVSANTVLRKGTLLIPISKYNSEQRRMVRPPLLLGLVLSIVILTGATFEITDWWNFEWIATSPFMRETYLFLFGIFGVLLYGVWLILINTKVLYQE